MVLAWHDSSNAAHISSQKPWIHFGCTLQLSALCYDPKWVQKHTISAGPCPRSLYFQISVPHVQNSFGRVKPRAHGSIGHEAGFFQQVWNYLTITFMYISNKWQSTLPSSARPRTDFTSPFKHQSKTTCENDPDLPWPSIIRNQSSEIKGTKVH